jgi:hypothetical protein
MRSEDSKKITQRAMEIASPFKPNLKDFHNGKSFNELYFNNEKFVQVFFYDRHDGYTDERIQIHFDLDKQEEFMRTVNQYKDQLTKAQEQAVNEFGLSKYDQQTYYYYHRAGNEFGYCHVELHERHKPTEDEEERRSSNYKYYEPKCSSCGDGGCIHCEAHRFIEGKIYY